jgi:hypothetical protein
MAKMKVAVFVAKNRIVLDEKPIPDVGPLDALIRITTTTICGTDEAGGGTVAAGVEPAGGAAELRSAARPGVPCRRPAFRHGA